MSFHWGVFLGHLDPRKIPESLKNCPYLLKEILIRHQSRSPRQSAYLSKAGVAPKEEAKTQAQIALDMRTGQNVGRA